ncbi:MAG: hypothetical protein K6G90_04250 [Clostridia bacterium]|nr:hypothetical protein [Clostridia bacterium]
MNSKPLKIAISLFLSILLLLLPLSVSADEAADFSEDLTRYPIVRVHGAGWALYNHYGADDQEQVYPVNEPDGYIMEKAKELLPLLGKAMITNDYAEYSEGLVNAIIPIYAKFIPDENGDIQNGPSIPPRPEVTDLRGSDGKYSIDDYYSFDVDWRLGPVVQGQQLAEFIDLVLDATGAEKVNLISRCESSSAVLVYLADHGADKVSSVIFESSMLFGSVQASDAFSGELKVDADMLNRFIARELGNAEDGGIRADFLSDAYTLELLKTTVSLLCTNGTVDVLGKILMKVYANVKDTVLPGIMMNSYGRLLSYWALVDNAHYEKARDLMLSDPKWDTFRERTDDYHYNYQIRTREILEDCRDDGACFMVISKYGLEMMPLLEESKELNDNSIATRDSSFGATCAKVDGFLSDEYIAAAKANGTDRYISADRKVDASTCVFPDTTWIIKNCPHGVINGVEELMTAMELRFLKSGGALTIYSDPDLPQFMILDQEARTLSPLTEENALSTETVYPDNFFKALCAFLKAFFRFMKNAIATSIAKSE